jgi:hypothetical protein
MLFRLARNQAGLARALWRVARGRVDVGPDEVALPYAGPDRALIYTLAVLSVLEVAVVHVLVSWPPLRWSLFALGVYGVLALIAFDGTLRQHPHLLRSGELVLRFGHFRSVRVPLEGLASARRHVTGGHTRTVERDGDALALSYMGETTVELRFSPPAPVEVDGRTHEVATVSFAAHDPRAAAALVRDRVGGQMLAPSACGPSGSGAAKPDPDGAGGVIPTV